MKILCCLQKKQQAVSSFGFLVCDKMNTVEKAEEAVREKNR